MSSLLRLGALELTAVRALRVTRRSTPNSPYSALSPGEKLDYKACEALEEIFKRVQFKIVDLEQTSLDEDVSGRDLPRLLVPVSQLTQTSRVLWSVLSFSWALSDIFF